MQTLYDEEKMKKAGKVPGLTRVGKKFRPNGSVPLMMAILDYRALSNGNGFVRRFDSIYRYHITRLADGRLEIHTDKTVEKGRHWASLHKVQEEIDRIKKMFPEPKKPEKTDKIRMTLKGKQNVLPRDQMIAAIAKLKKKPKRSILKKVKDMVIHSLNFTENQ